MQLFNKPSVHCVPNHLGVRELPEAGHLAIANIIRMCCRRMERLTRRAMTTNGSSTIKSDALLSTGAIVCAIEIHGQAQISS